MRALRLHNTRCKLSRTRPLACLATYHSFCTSRPNQSRLDPLPILRSIDVEGFQSNAFTPEQPVQLPAACFVDIPAVTKWFHPVSASRSGSHSTAPDDTRNHDINVPKGESAEIGNDRHVRSLNHAYLAQFSETTVPLELTTNVSEDGSATESFEFSRTEAPLSLFLSILKAQEPTSRSRVYIAQAPLPSLPSALQADLPTPDIVMRAGRGEIYDSSIWIGAAPTYTPLHRDPNPNLFVQLAGVKRIRVFRPEVGREIFDTATRQMSASAAPGSISYPPRSSEDAAITTPLGVRTGDEALVREGAEEIMRGKARRVLEDAVWGEDLEKDGSVIGFEAELGAGDAVFVPKGWWHSIKGVGGGVVGSVNWWFR